MLHPSPASRARRPIQLSLGIAIAALLVLALAPSTATAACGSSTPSSQSFPDSAGDALPGAPEILSVDASLDAGCRLTIDPKLSAALSPSQLVSIQLGFSADEFIDREILVYPGFSPALWDVDFLGVLAPFGQAGFSATLDELGLPAPTQLGIFVVASDLTTSAYDESPLVTDPMHRLQVNFAPPPPPPPPPPPAPPAAKPAAPATKQVTGCVVPKLKGLSVKKAKAALKKAGCKYKLRGKGRVRSFSPKAGTRTDGTVQVKCKKKRKKKRSRSALLAQVARQE